VSLELADVPGLGGFDEPEHGCVHGAGEVAAVVLELELLVRRRVLVVDRNASVAQVHHETKFLAVAGLEEAQYAALELDPRRPPEAVPDGAVAVASYDGGAKVRARLPRIGLLVVVVDLDDRGVLRLR
jgi:hypothetical protein